MNKLKTKKQLKKWLDEMGIVNYNINDDLTVDINRDINFARENLSKIPIQFGVVGRSFDFSWNNLTSLKGSPKECKYFDCSNNKLTSLKYHPESCEIFKCWNNPNLTKKYLKTVDFSFVKGELATGYDDINDKWDKIIKAKKEIREQLGDFFIGHFPTYTITNNLIITAKGNVNMYDRGLIKIPFHFGIVEGCFNINNNHLKSLKYSPIKCESFYCQYNYIESLKYSPKECKYFDCSNNNLITLEGHPEKCEDFYCYDNPFLTYEYLNNFDFSFVKGELRTQYLDINDKWNKKNNIQIIEWDKKDEHKPEINFTSISKFTCKTKDTHNNIVYFNLLTDIVSTDKESNLITIHNDYRYTTCYIDKICRNTELTDMYDTPLFENDKIKNIKTNDCFSIRYVNGAYFAVPNSETNKDMMVINLFGLLEYGNYTFYNKD